MPNNWWVNLCFSAGLLLAAPLAVQAQTTGGSLIGKVTDEAGQPVAGAAIEVSGCALQGSARTATDVEGRYLIPLLPVGMDYQVRVEAPGYAVVLRRGIEIPLGTTVSLPFALGRGTTEIVVTAAAPVVDPKRTEIGTSISEKLITSLPLQRNWMDTVYLTPGVVSSGIGTTNWVPAIGGASGPENAYLVNGVDTTESWGGSNAVALNFDFIEATEIKTGGMDAEYGALMGGAVTAVTKSGGNEFHGGLFAYYWDDGLGAKERDLANPSVVRYLQSQKIYDVGGNLGGYFVKDRLWFFAAYDWNRQESTFSAGSDPMVLLNGQPSYSAYHGTGYKDTVTDPQYALKLTWNVSPSHKLALSFFGDDFEREYHRQVANPVAVACPATITYPTYALSLQWNATWTPKFFTEVVVARRHSTGDDESDNALARSSWTYWYRYGAQGGQARLIPVGPPNAYSDPYAGGTGRIDLAAWRPSYGGSYYDHVKDVNDQVRLKGTNLFSAAGRHELSYGLQLYDIHYDENVNYYGPGVTNRTSQLYDASLGVFTPNPFYGRTSTGGASIRWEYEPSSPTSYLFRAGYFMGDMDKKTKQTYTAYWAQDNWNLTDYFMLKLGVRLDQIHMKGGNNTINVPAQLMPQGGPRGAYMNGIGREITINDEWAPRLGFTWDVAHNDKSKLYGFYGMYYERLPNDLAERALTDEMGIFDYYLDAGLTQPADFAYTFGLYPTRVVGGPKGQKLKGSYNEEWILGFQYQIRPDFSMGVRALYRSLGRVIEDLSTDQGQSYIITNPDNWVGTWTYLPRNGVWGWYTFPKPVRIYKALEITADKRFSNGWMMQASYVLSRLEGNYEGLYSNDNGQWDPNITSKYDLPQLLVDAYGLLPNDRTHVLHLFGGYFFQNIPLELSANFQLASGTPISKLGYDDAYGQNEGFCTPRGTAGRTPTVWSLDVGVQYTFTIWKSDLALRADVFNVTNEQRTTTVDQTYNTVNLRDHQTWPYFKMETAHQQARRIRLAIRWTF